MSHQDRSDEALTRAHWQAALFDAPSRAELVQCVANWNCKRVRVCIHRNHAIEPVLSAAAPYAAWNGLEYEWALGPYDDSLSFATPLNAEVHVIWLDTGRIVGVDESQIGAWIIGRLQALRASHDGPIILAAWPLAPEHLLTIEHAAVRDVHLAHLTPIAARLATRWLDPRTESISGTRLSNRACLELARELACRWLPAACLPPIKCVALDLDGTLYRGVLGEDGPDGIELTAGHLHLQELVASLRDAGMLLALVSRNERADVEALFAKRSDMTLRLQDFSVVEVSWGDKVDALRLIAGKLRIGLDAIVVVDDNPGELASIAASTLAVTVHAREEATQTAVALANVAGVFRWSASVEDRLRADDLRASDERDTLRDAGVSPEAYLRSLDIRLRYFVGAPDHLQRAADLVRKTNQFNLSLRRMSQTEIARRMEVHRGNVVAIGLADRLSDSGVVGVVIGSYREGVLEVEEIAVSCRALGRRLEDELITRALLLMAEAREVTSVSFKVAHGARNGPGRDWLEGYAGHAIEDGADTLAMPYAAILEKPLPGIVSVSVHHCEVMQ